MESDKLLQVMSLSGLGAFWVMWAAGFENVDNKNKKSNQNQYILFKT